jgi:hypothetical protein
MGTRKLASCAAITALFWTLPAQAFCPATTCDPIKTPDSCEIDDEGCVTTGQQLYWAGGCIPFSVHLAASAKHEIDYETFEEAVEKAFESWTNVDCGDGEKPSIEAVNVGAVVCENPEYNEDRQNAYVIMFRDWSWPYIGKGDSLGYTSLHFDRDSGEIFDADVEINGAVGPVSVGDPVEGADLESILVHEIGHFLGLGHTGDEDAVMYPGYEAGDDSHRDLSDDDVAAICALYPPDRKLSSLSCEPRHGFSQVCAEDQEEPINHAEPKQETGGCSLSGLPATSQTGLGALLLSAAGLALATLRRRRRA